MVVLVSGLSTPSDIYLSMLCLIPPSRMLTILPLATLMPPTQDYTRFPVMLVLGLSTLPDIYRSMMPSDVLGMMRLTPLKLSSVQARLEDFFESEFVSRDDMLVRRQDRV